MMRRISMWNITKEVSENIAAHKASVELWMFPDPKVIAVLSIGRDHNYLRPGHYVVIDRAVEGPNQLLSVRITPVGVDVDWEQRFDPGTHWQFVGMLSGPRDAAPCALHALVGALTEDAVAMSWLEQDASNS
ncbi:MAG: hypothetical protein U0103_29950 [Candidatus Obscuribacterales bacterium]